MDKLNVCVVSDDPAVRDSIKDMIESAGMNAMLFESLHTFRSKTEAELSSCLVFDTHQVDLCEVNQQAALEAVCAAMPVILITDRGDVATAVRGMKSGAVDIVQKPYQKNRLLNSVNNVKRRTHLGTGGSSNKSNAH